MTNSASIPPVIAVIGRSDSGKTTLIERLIPELVRRGYRVATLKHHAHNTPVDVPGKDSWRHAQAGARRVVLVAPEMVATFDYAPESRHPEQIAARMGDVDLVLAEGFRWAALPSIEVSRAARGRELVGDPAHRLAVVADYPLGGLGCPVVHLDDIDGIADVIAAVLREQRDGEMNASPE